MSSLLFALYLKPYCLSIERNQLIRGFHRQSVAVKLLAIADDVAMFRSDLESVSEA